MEFQKDNSFVTGRLKSVTYAFKGALKLISTEHSIMVQFSIGILISILGFIMNISATEWLFQTLSIGLVMSIEGLNTAVEKIADFIHPNYSQRIGFIKHEQGENRDNQEELQSNHNTNIEETLARGQVD